MMKSALLAVAFATALTACSPPEAGSPPAAGATARAAAQQPDFSGLWFPAGRQQDPQRPEYTPPAQAALADYEKAFTLDDDPGRYCQWPGMPRAIWGAPFTVEIQQRPQDITIYWEGYGMYRKIYMADHSPPEPILPSAMGHSVAHWEGDTLVIETTNLKPYPYMTRMATSSDAHGRRAHAARGARRQRPEDEVHRQRARAHRSRRSTRRRSRSRRRCGIGRTCSSSSTPARMRCGTST